ncbi:MAG: VacJ family lipoprotein [Rhodobacteraceae bacterium]|nr:VacJ family lipoprotein [Paracoccaceae bacterium]
MDFSSNPSRGVLLAGVVALTLAGCSAAPETGEINDPYENVNRRVHAFNRGLDKVVVRPTSQVYGSVLPKPVRTGVSNFAANLSLPGQVANNILQGRPMNALTNTVRFGFNTIFGLGGLMDPASNVGLPLTKTGFAETLAVWGVREGAYVELPAFGPSTERATVGLVADIVLDPLSFVLNSPEKYVPMASEVLSRVGDRYTYSDFIDSILYESADSYAQSRLFYLQNRRFDLGESSDDDAFDPYETLDPAPAAPAR